MGRYQKPLAGKKIRGLLRRNEHMCIFSTEIRRTLSYTEEFKKFPQSGSPTLPRNKKLREPPYLCVSVLKKTLFNIHLGLKNNRHQFSVLQNFVGMGSLKIFVYHLR